MIFTKFVKSQEHSHSEPHRRETWPSETNAKAVYWQIEPRVQRLVQCIVSSLAVVPVFFSFIERISAFSLYNFIQARNYG